MADIDWAAFNGNLVAEFRANNGKVTGHFENAPLVLITHTGARSAKQYTTPLVYSRDDDCVVIIASKGGSPTHPAWYHNLVANPQVTVELPGQTYEATAVQAEGAERDRLFQQQAELMPFFFDYAKNTDGVRTIPVFVLERA